MSSSRFLVFVLIWGLLASVQANGQQKVSVGAHYYSGEYQQLEATTFSFVPFLWSYQKKAWKFKLSTAWVRVDGPGDINNDAVASDSNQLREDSESGFGDVRLAVTYQFQRPLPGKVWVDAGLTAKLPTADVSKGLGTGKSDQKLKLDFMKQISSFYGLMSVSYNKRGAPDDFPLRNVRALSLGFSQRLDKGHSWGSFYDYRTASRSENDSIKEVSLFYSLPTNSQWKVTSYGLLGLSRSSAQYGLGFQAARSF